MYGDLILADSYYGGARGRRWKVDWDRTPQPVQIKLKALRGCKDKLPGQGKDYKGTLTIGQSQAGIWM